MDKDARPRGLRLLVWCYGWRPCRVIRGLWPGRNLLRRGSDRAETALVVLLVAMFGAGGPVIALEAGGRPSGPLLSVFGIQLLAGALLGVGFAAHRLLDRWRLRGWEAEWEVIGPRWARGRGGSAGDERARP